MVLTAFLLAVNIRISSLNMFWCRTVCSMILFLESKPPNSGLVEFDHKYLQLVYVLSVDSQVTAMRDSCSFSGSECCTHSHSSLVHNLIRFHKRDISSWVAITFFLFYLTLRSYLLYVRNYLKSDTRISVQLFWIFAVVDAAISSA